MIKSLSNTIKKSKLDDRAYRYVKLQNSLRCILVQDKDAEKSSACMFVGTGSLSDPVRGPESKGPGITIDGLAHFCEHMLFLGTKKYPVENHYTQFITSNGGGKNAATGEDYTYYYFDIKNNKFPEALDIFSQFFKEPLFTPSGTDRELNAVDNEYKKNISNESRGTTQIIKSHVCIPGSLLNRFSTGNLETLKSDTILTDLKSFYDQHYSSNLMSLVLVGKQSLDELQELAVENFHQIVNKELPVKDWSGETVFDKDHSFGRIFKVIPQKHMKSLIMSWQMHSSGGTFSRKKSSRYLSHLVGHEGPNSLLSELIS